MLVFSALSVGVFGMLLGTPGLATSLLSVSDSSLMAVLFGSVIVVMAKAATISPMNPLTKYGILQPYTNVRIQ